MCDGDDDCMDKSDEMYCQSRMCPPDQETVASAGADETLRLWKCFGLNDKQRKAKKNQLLTDKKSAIHTSLSSCIR